MLSQLFAGRLLRIAFVGILALATLPLATTFAATDATRTEISYTSSLTEVLEAGEESVDDAGIYHVRGRTELQEISGDLTGTAIVTINVDALTDSSCDSEPCPGLREVWGEIRAEDESGWWTGRFTESYSTIPGEEYAFTSVALNGHGGNAGKNFIGEVVSVEESTLTIEGVVSTLGAPTLGMDANVTVCFGEESSRGAFVSTGAIQGDGAVEAFFIPSSLIWTHTYNLYGVLQLSNDHGTVTIKFVNGAQDVGSASIAFGTYVITDGTGAYAATYGNGRVIAALHELPACESGFGVGLDLYGVAQIN